MRASLSESTDFTGLVDGWQYLLKTLLMWLWWVCILMSDDTAVHCQRSKNYKRSDDLWRFACGDVFSSLTRSLVSLASLGLCFSSKTRPTGFLVLHGRVYNLRHLKLCHCSNRGFSVLLTLQCTGTWNSPGQNILVGHYFFKAFNSSLLLYRHTVSGNVESVTWRFQIFTQVASTLVVKSLNLRPTPLSPHWTVATGNVDLLPVNGSGSCATPAQPFQPSVVFARNKTRIANDQNISGLMKIYFLQ